MLVTTDISQCAFRAGNRFFDWLMIFAAATPADGEMTSANNSTWLKNELGGMLAG